jgi:hypothetical protein
LETLRQLRQYSHALISRSNKTIKEAKMYAAKTQQSNRFPPNYTLPRRPKLPTISFLKVNYQWKGDGCPVIIAWKNWNTQPKKKEKLIRDPEKIVIFPISPITISHRLNAKEPPNP